MRSIYQFLVLIAILIAVPVPAFAQETVDDSPDAPVLWGGSRDAACRAAIEGASCGPTAEASRATFQRLNRICGAEFGTVMGSNSEIFQEYRALWRSCVVDTPPPATPAEVPGSVARCGLDGQTPRLRCGGSSDGSPDGHSGSDGGTSDDGHSGGSGGGGDSHHPRRRYIPFCGRGTRAVTDERGRMRCECIDSRHLIQRFETRWSVPEQMEGLDEAQTAARRFDRRHDTNTTIVILACANSGPTAQAASRDEMRSLETRVTNLERRAYCYQLDEQGRPVLDDNQRPLRRPAAEVSQECRDLWQLMMDVATNRTDITTLRQTVTRIDGRVTNLERWAAYPCHIPYEEFEHMNEEARQQYCREHPGTDSGASLANLLRFQFGAGVLGIARLHMDVVSLYATAHAQWEPMVSDDVGFYVRLMAGYGTLNDPDGRYGQVAIGESGFWGIAGGLAFRLMGDGDGTDRRSVLTLNLGPSFYSSLVEGRRGRATGTYRWHDLGIEARLRWEPIQHLGIELMLGLAWDRAQVDRPDAHLNAQGFPDFFDEDGAAIEFGASLSGTF